MMAAWASAQRVATVPLIVLGITIRVEAPKALSP